MQNFLRDAVEFLPILLQGVWLTVVVTIGSLLLSTVLTQLLVPRALAAFGWGPVLAVGLVLLGVPGALYSVSDVLGVVLALSAVRGVGSPPTDGSS